MKKIFALVISALLVVSMLSVGFAASITLNRHSTYDEDSTGARTYTAYKVMDADTNDTSGPISYSVATDSPWLSALQADAQIWFNVNLAADGSKYIVTPKTGVTDANAIAIATYFSENIPSSGVTSYTITPGTTATVDNGYYLIVPSDGAPNLTLVTADVTITEKNPYITTEKTGPETSYNVGDTITYTATVTIPADTETSHPVILHDTMDNVLAFDSTSVSATIDGAAYSGYTLVTAPTDTCTFEISIPVNTTTLGKTIIFTYDAKLTDAAATDEGYVNELFGQHGDYTTKPTDVTDWTFDFSFLKDFTGVENPELTATFELQTNTHTDASGSDPAKDAPSGTAIKFNAKDGHKYEKSDDNSGDTVLTVVDGETLNIVGLKEGIYWLVEKTTSTGYNLLDGPVPVIITDTSTQNADGSWTVSHTVTATGYQMTDGVITVENNSGTVLPSTGGIGTTLFYVGGGILVLAAIILLVTKKRMAGND